MKGSDYIKHNYTPTNDYIFKRLFGHPGNEDITQSFLNSILENKIHIVSLNNNTILEKDIIDEKTGILDIRATLNNNIPCDIEMQVARIDNIEDRMLFYWSKIFYSSLSVGDSYNKLPKTIVILITDFEIKKFSEISSFHRTWRIYDDKLEYMLTDKLELHIIEIPKLEKALKNNTDISEKDLVNWIKFIKKPNQLGDKDMENEKIRKAKKELNKILADEKERYLADLRSKYLSDRATMMENSFRDGKENGQKEGQYAKAVEIAKNMLKDKKDITEIIKYTGLTKEEIEKLKIN